MERVGQTVDGKPEFDSELRTWPWEGPWQSLWYLLPSSVQSNKWTSRSPHLFPFSHAIRRNFVTNPQPLLTQVHFSFLSFLFPYTFQCSAKSALPKSEQRNPSKLSHLCRENLTELPTKRFCDFLWQDIPAPWMPRQAWITLQLRSLSRYLGLLDKHCPGRDGAQGERTSVNILKIQFQWPGSTSQRRGDKGGSYPG